MRSSAAGFGQNVRRLAHIFHAAGDHDVVGAGFDLIVGEHNRLHARSAHFVNGGAAGAVWYVGTAGGLARGCLAQSGR